MRTFVCVVAGGGDVGNGLAVPMVPIPDTPLMPLAMFEDFLENG